MRGRFFGPFPNARATRETLLLLQKLFLHAPLPSDTFFANRIRPCLQYQIKRCSGPCVGLISERFYAGRAMRMKVLEGRGAEADRRISQQRMEDAARSCSSSVPRASRPDQRLKASTRLRSVTRNVDRDIDAVALVSGTAATTVFRSCSCAAVAISAARILSARGIGGSGEAALWFLAAVLLGTRRAGRVLISQPIEDADLLEATLSERVEHSVRIRSGVRGVRARWLEMARTNAELGLNMRRATEATRPSNARRPSPRCSDSARRPSAWSVST